MPKFFSTNISDGKIIIDTEDVRHIKNVLRLKCGDSVKICDGKGYDYICEIADIRDKEVVCNIKEKNFADTEPNIKVTLYQGVPKSTKMDYIIQKNTELGISEIVPCMMSRCVVKLENKKAEEKKQQRWQKISEEAAKQSGRGIIPTIHQPHTFKEAVEKLKKEDLAFALYECELEQSLKKTLISNKDVKSVGFMIGPEGGFDPAEIEMLHNAGIKSIGLGKRILRTETAGEAVLSMIMYEIGDINE